MTLPKLGAKQAVIHTRQPRLMAQRFMTRIAPPVLNRDHIDPAPDMFGNDTLGNCTSVGLLNHMRATSALNSFKVNASTDDAIRFYELSAGYNPANPASDQGAVESDVLTYASRNGVTAGGNLYIPIWGTAETGDLNGVRNIMAGMGAAYFGVQLALADQADGIWDTTTPGDQTPGSWGGHCLLGWSYTGTADTDIVELLTWGTKQKCTWRWLRSRIMECHGLLWRQLMPANGLAPGGEDWHALVSANEAYLAGAA